MMLFDLTAARDPLRKGPLVVARAIHLRIRGGGELQVAAGRIWLTQNGRWDDLVLSRGERIRLAAGQDVVAEPWQAGNSAQLTWCADQPLRPVDVLRAALARALRGAARGVDAFGARLAAWARSAEASARRAQGSMACGESIASSGALQ